MRQIESRYLQSSKARTNNITSRNPSLSNTTKTTTNNSNGNSNIRNRNSGGIVVQSKYNQSQSSSRKIQHESKVSSKSSKESKSKSSTTEDENVAQSFDDSPQKVAALIAQEARRAGLNVTEPDHLGKAYMWRYARLKLLASAGAEHNRIKSDLHHLYEENQKLKIQLDKLKLEQQEKDLKLKVHKILEAFNGNEGAAHLLSWLPDVLDDITNGLQRQGVVCKVMPGVRTTAETTSLIVTEFDKLTCS